MTQPDDNALLQKFTARVTYYVEDTGVIETDNGTTKGLKLLLKTSQRDPSLQSFDAIQLKQEEPKLKKKKERKKEELRTKYRIITKGFKVVIEELKQIISEKSEKLIQYRKGDSQYRKNKLF